MDKTVDVVALQPTYKQLFELLGEPALVKIYNHYRGSELSLPIHLYNRQLARKRIISQYTGSNQDELTRFYGYSQRWTSQILKDGHEEL